MEEDQSINNAEDDFIAFKYKDFDFLIPLTDVTRICEQPPENTTLNSEEPDRRFTSCIIVNFNGKPLTINADEIVGVVNIKTSSQHEMPIEAKCPLNHWIFGVADMGEGEKPAYLLDCNLIFGKFAAGVADGE